MASITSRSATFYTMLCHVLEHNDIPYERIDDWCVTCLVSGREGDIRLNFTVDDSKMLVTLYAPTVRHIPQERLPDLSLAALSAGFRFCMFAELSFLSCSSSFALFKCTTSVIYFIAQN